MTTTEVLLIANLSAVSAAAGAIIGHSKARVQAGALAGLLLGPLGVFIAAMMDDRATMEREEAERVLRWRAAHPPQSAATESTDPTP